MTDAILCACTTCGKEFSPRPGKANKFCGVPCFREHQRTRVKVKVAPSSKACSSCGKAMPIGKFYRQASAQDGFKSECKLCSSARCKAIYKANRESILQKTRKYHAENKDKAAARRARNAEKIKRYMDRYRAENAEAIAAASAAYAERNKDRLAEWRKIYRRNNPDKVVAWKAARRARKLAAGGTFNAKDVALLYKLQGNKCAICRCRLARGDTHIDHVVPLARGGSNGRENLQILCRRCNQSKGARDPIEHMQRLGFLI